MIGGRSMNMEYYWRNVTDKEKPVVLGEIPVPMPLPT
jgi:hypothetical protein